MAQRPPHLVQGAGEPIAGNRSVDALIRHCFCFVSDEDQRKFRRKFARLPHDSHHIMHALRELVVGAYLGSIRFTARYDCRLYGKRPDWCVLAGDSNPMAIVEVVNFHVDQTTEREIEAGTKDGSIYVCWRDHNRDNNERLRGRLQEKAAAYAGLVERVRLPYVVAVFSDFRAAVDAEEVRECVLDGEDALFRTQPHVSGVLHFEERAGRYWFTYIPNPHGARKLRLPVSGVF